MSTFHATLGALVILMTGPLHAATSEAESSNALDAYERGHYALAYALWARQADAGEAEAARLALQMYRYGPQLYGQAFVISSSQRQRWLHVASGALAGAERFATASH